MVQLILMAQQMAMLKARLTDLLDGNTEGHLTEVDGSTEGSLG
jgi:hypothetical protein